MAVTKFEELKIKQKSLADLSKNSIGTGLYNYEKSFQVPIDSFDHNAHPIHPEWIRLALKELWEPIQKRIREIAEKDIAVTRYDAIKEAGEFLADNIDNIKR
jgi:hypothetical protein